MKLIGLTGRARAGKDTVGEILAREAGYATMSFAAPIKEACKVAFALSDEQLFGNEKEAPIKHLGGKSPRQIMQLFGTDFARDMICDDIWLQVAERRMISVKHQVTSTSPLAGFIPAGIVFTDVRFDNEAQWVRDQGGEVWQIERKDIDPVSEHVSEAGVPEDLVDLIILNNGTLGDLRLMVLESLETQR